MSARYSFPLISRRKATKSSKAWIWAATSFWALAHLSGPAAAELAERPLSAIDWLSESVTAPLIAAVPLPPADPVQPPLNESPVAESAATPDVSVSSLDDASPDATGLLSSQTTGLPATLWAESAEATLLSLVSATEIETLPAVQDLLVTLMLAEADAPADARPDGPLFLARVDKLLDLGALDPAQALLEASDPSTPERFRRYFDVSLLTGTEDTACGLMKSRPGLAPTLPARIFCLARDGDWQAAVLTLGTARALGQVTDDEDLLLSQFLDPALAEDGTLPPPARPSPLVFRLREAVGEGMLTARLPLAFAHADLRPTVAWRNQMAAAERLSRTGALEENVLQALYTFRVPSASGGIYDRARAFQTFDTALAGADLDGVAAALGPVWEAMQEVRAEVAFARLYGTALADLPLEGEAARLANRISLLAPDYRAAATSFAPLTAEERLWQAVALGQTDDLTGTTPRARAVLAAFQGAPPPETIGTEIAQGKLGEALLRAISLVQQGLTGDADAMTDALAVLLAARLDDTARRAALQYLILERDQ